MTGSIIELLIAAAVFVGSHFGISSTGLRDELVRRIGERAYLALYSAVALILLAWLIRAYATVGDPLMLWVRPPLLIVLPLVVMPLALLLFVGGYSQRNPTAVMQGKPLPTDRPAPGVLAITRHPLMWAIGLWAIVHLIISDSIASFIFFGAFAILALHGTRVLDAKKRRTWPPEDWQRFAAATSNIPFAAVFTSRNEIKIAEIGWWRIMLVGVLYIALIFLHGVVLGVPVVVRY
ncbi:MAG TPA: NnrU family protein [Candidatus Angelobacter sp.]|nr:NnrU family protein [Candidatus Angelobacter sp.]